jgi:hypothetical protein
MRAKSPAGLGDLPQDYALSEPEAERIYGEAVRGALKVLMAQAVDTLEKENEEGEKKMGITAGSIMPDVLKAIEFAEQAQVFGPGPDGKEVAGTSLRPEADFPASVLKYLYRQSLIEGFSESNTELLGKAERLALLLGLDDLNAAEVNIDVGSLIIRQYLSVQLKNGPVGATEREFMKDVQDALGLKEEKVEELIEGAQKAQVLKALEAFGEARTDSVPDADDVRSLRDEAERFKVDLKEDLDMTQPQLERFFMYELEDFLDTGEGGGEELEEAAKQLHVSEARAQELLEDLVQKRINNGVLVAWIANKDGKTAEATEEMERVVKLAALAPCKAKVPAAGPSALSDLYLLYQMGGRTADQTALLADVLGIAPELA